MGVPIIVMKPRERFTRYAEPSVRHGSCSVFDQDASPPVFGVWFDRGCGCADGRAGAAARRMDRVDPNRRPGLLLRGIPGATHRIVPRWTDGRLRDVRDRRGRAVVRLSRRFDASSIDLTTRRSELDRY